MSIVKARLARCNFDIIEWRRAVVSEMWGTHLIIQIQKIRIKALWIEFTCMLHSLCHMWMIRIRYKIPWNISDYWQSACLHEFGEFPWSLCIRDSVKLLSNQSRARLSRHMRCTNHSQPFSGNEASTSHYIRTGLVYHTSPRLQSGTSHANHILNPTHASQTV